MASAGIKRTSWAKSPCSSKLKENFIKISPIQARSATFCFHMRSFPKSLHLIFLKMLSKQPQIHNLWQNLFKRTHKVLADQYCQLFADLNLAPPFFTNQQSTNCLPKYRPITCLLAIYKVLTLVLCANNIKRDDVHNVIDKEQKVAQKTTSPCKEALIIDTGFLSKTKYYDSLNRS